MKKLLKSALVAGCVLLTVGFAKAQTKIGYLNFQAVMGSTKEAVDINKAINDYQKTFQDTQTGMSTELQTKGADYDKNRATMNDAARLKAEGELQEINKRLQDFNQTATTQIQTKYNELLKPLVDKVKAYTSQVAKEGGYTIVMDTSTTELIVAPEADNLEARVKAKLGSSVAAPATSPAAKGPVKKN
jgi:outer membrane protein